MIDTRLDKPNPARTLAGRKAQRYGQMFENLFRSNLTRARLAFDRMPDGCRVVGRGRLIRVKTPFDWIVTEGGRTAVLDTKTFDEHRLMPHMIEEHQLRALEKHARAGAVAGYVIWFRPCDLVVFADASQLYEIFESGEGVHASEIPLIGSSRKFDPRQIFETAPQAQKE